MLQAAFGEDACMPAQQLGLIKRSIQRSAGGVNTPEGLAHMLAGMGGRCFLRAAQGADLLKRQGDRDDRCFHVSCDRSIDRWKVMHTRHGMGYCYHGCNMLWSERAVKKDCGDLRSPREIRELVHDSLLLQPRLTFETMAFPAKLPQLFAALLRRLDTCPRHASR